MGGLILGELFTNQFQSKPEEVKEAETDLQEARIFLAAVRISPH